MRLPTVQDLLRTKRIQQAKIYRKLHGKPMWADQPVSINLDTQNRCSLSCVYCNPQNIFVEKHSEMPMSCLKRLLDVLEEIHQKTAERLPQVMGEPVPTSEIPTSPEERDPLIRQILTSYDASASKKEITIRFYAQDGEVINFVIKRKKNLPIGLESDILTRYPLIRGPLEDYAKGRIDILTTLSEIERMFYT